MDDDEQRDRLSELPHSLIHLILSFLPIRDVVSTTLLSKTWNKLWTEVPCFNIWECISEGNRAERVRNFVNRALMLWRGKEILKFEIDIVDFDLSLFGDVDLWVRFAVEHNVEELNIHLDFYSMIMSWKDPITDSKRDVYWAPQCLNSCSSIRKLSLLGCNLRNDVSPPWNQLKYLRILGFCFSECLINRILLGSPQLEVFELDHIESYESLNIQSSSLKELNIDKGGINVHYVSNPLEPVDTMLRIYCPNLEVLKISGYLYSKCLFSDFPALTDVTVGLVPRIVYLNGACIAFELLGEAFGPLFSTIQRAQKVTISASCEVLKLQKKNLLSPLPNAKFLKLGALDTDIGGMMDFLGIFPNIEILVLEVVGSDCVPQKINPEDYLDFDANPSDPPLLQLKKVQIISPFKDTLILRFIAFLLYHCSMLEKLVIQAVRCPSGDKHKRLFKVAQALLNMPKSSPTARVIFKKV